MRAECDGARCLLCGGVPAGDPLPAALPPERRATLVATGEPRGTLRFDIRLHGAAETVCVECV